MGTRDSYAELKALNPAAWRMCIEAASGLQIKHGLTLEQAAAVEGRFVDLVYLLLSK